MFACIDEIGIFFSSEERSAPPAPEHEERRSGGGQRLLQVVFRVVAPLVSILALWRGFSQKEVGARSGIPQKQVSYHLQKEELDDEIYRRLLPLARFDMTPKLVQYFKAALDEVGLVGGPCRPPRLPLTAAERAALGEAMAVLGATVA